MLHAILAYLLSYYNLAGQHKASLTVRSINLSKGMHIPIYNTLFIKQEVHLPDSFNYLHKGLAGLHSLLIS